MATLLFGRAPKPPIIEMICPKPYDGAGFTRLATRRDVIGLIGPCQHITDGHGSIEWYHDFFSTGGQRQYDALVDYVIGRDGRIGMLNDPGGTREGWASGGSDGLEGPGIAFYQRYGPAQNRKLWSKEHVAVDGEPWTDAQWAASVALDVWHLDQLQVPYTTYPIHPNGLDINFSHFMFATKPCAGSWYKANEARFENDVRAGLKAAQFIADPPPIPPVPAPPPSIYPKGWNEAKAKKRFGKLTRHMIDGSVKQSGFNEKGKISLLWLARVKQTGVSPEAQDHYFVADNDQGPTRDRVTIELVTFESGWVLGRPAERADWNWLY